MKRWVVGTGALLTALFGMMVGQACSSEANPATSSGGGGSGSSTTSSSSSGSFTTSSNSSSSSSGEPCGYFGGPCCPKDECYAFETGPLGCLGGVCRGALGHSCTMNEECVSSACLPIGRCSAPCAGAADCPPAPEWSCGPLEGAATDMCQCQPSAQETCDGRDNDCNGYVDEGGGLDCEPGHSCQGGVCKCVWSVCGGVCTDTTSDPTNCGACGVTCAGGEVCNAGNCVTILATGQWNPQGITVDATHVYWTNTNSGTVMKVPIGGGAPVTLASGQGAPRGIAVAGANVYWATQDAVMKAPIAGGAPTILASGQTNPIRIAVNATHVFWTDGHDFAVRKVPLGGGAPITLATTPNSYLEGIALDGTDVYWASGDAIMKVPLGGGAAVTLASALGNAFGVAVGSTHVYWTTVLAPSTVRKVPIGGGAPTLLATASPSLGNFTSHIVVDATHAYYTLGESVMKVPLGGGAPTAIVSKQINVQVLAVDATYVFWATGNLGDDIIFKKPK